MLQRMLGQVGSRIQAGYCRGPETLRQRPVFKSLHWPRSLCPLKSEATGLHFLIFSGSGKPTLTLVKFKMTRRKSSRDTSCYYCYHYC